MKYLYYPGCSLKCTGISYEESLLSIFNTLKVDVTELKDWNCCGATAYMSVDALKGYAVTARNLALAEKQFKDEPEINMIAPCAACYMALVKTQKIVGQTPELKAAVTHALAAAGLEYNCSVKVRHPLDVLVNDFGVEEITKAVKFPLKNIKVACYYGCQTVRPYATFDDARNPVTMDKLVSSLGATPVEWPLKAKCCGASISGIMPEVGMPMSHNIITEAIEKGADIIATACPLCQFNLECYQDQMRKKFNDTNHIPVLYFSQLIGLALGLPMEKLGLKRMFISPDKVYESMKGGEKVNA